jgi:tRNA(adenine34) deaminase
MLLRRTLLAQAALAALTPRAWADDGQRWIEAAFEMKRRAESWGDQPYGAVLVLGGAVVGEGPSRVIQRNDPDAHAEREAIKDAQRRLGRSALSGSVLYSTSRPCGLCEAAAASAGVSRMVFGAALTDAGAPRAR